MLIIISGLPGTGKTSFAEALARKLKIAHLNSDKVRDSMGRRGHYDRETKRLIYETLLQTAENYLKAGQDVIVDATFYKKSYRELYQKLARDYQAPLKWIALTAQESTIKKRVQTKRVYSEADFEVYQKIKATYEPLTIEHLVLSSDRNSISEMLDMAFVYLYEEPESLNKL
jgi:predicted kinase